MPQGPLAFTQVNNQLNAAALNGTLFQAANQSGVTTSAGLATTYVGLCLSNPAGNTNRLILRNVAGGLIVAPAAETGFMLITGYVAAGVVTHTTALVPYPALLGGGAVATANVDSACTIVGTPAYSLLLGETATATSYSSFSVDLNGSIVIPPGGYVAIGTTIAGPTSGFIGSMQWLESLI